MKASYEERILTLEGEIRRLRGAIEDGRRDSFSHSTDRIFVAKTDPGDTGSYPAAPANVFPVLIQDVVVDTTVAGDQAVTRRDRSLEAERNVFSSKFLADQSEIFCIEHLGHLLALQGGGSVNIIEGRSVGSIAAQATGQIDNLSVVTGTYDTIADTAQTEDVENHTTAFLITDGAWVIAIEQDDGTWYVLNAECLGDPTYGVIQLPESTVVASGGYVPVTKTPELIVGVTSGLGSSLQELHHFTVNKAMKRLELVESTYPGTGPPLYLGGHIEGELIRVTYMSKD